MTWVTTKGVRDPLAENRGRHRSSPDCSRFSNIRIEWEKSGDTRRATPSYPRASRKCWEMWPKRRRIPRRYRLRTHGSGRSRWQLRNPYSQEGYQGGLGCTTHHEWIRATLYLDFRTPHVLEPNCTGFGQASGGAWIHEHSGIELSFVPHRSHCLPAEGHWRSWSSPKVSHQENISQMLHNAAIEVYTTLLQMGLREVKIKHDVETQSGLLGNGQEQEFGSRCLSSCNLLQCHSGPVYFFTGDVNQHLFTYCCRSVENVLIPT